MVPPQIFRKGKNMKPITANFGGWALYALGVLVLSVLARIGWELGGRVWAFF
jgi:hypothetical protein